MVALLLLSAGAVTAVEAQIKSASLRTLWVPQAQFAGYYTALAKGFYREAGIDLEIRPAGPGISPLNNVASGKETFATEWLTSGITLAAKGAPVVHIAQMVQTSGLMLVSFKESGITNPEQLDGRTVGIWPGALSIAPTVLFEQFQVRPKLANQQFSMNEFLNRKLEVASAMIYNEYHTILESGIKPEALNTIHFRDYGLNFPEDGIYVHRDTLRKDPELCRNFIKASIRGWLYAFEHPEEALSIIMDATTEAKTGATREHQASMLAEIKKMMLHRVGSDGIGELDNKDFSFVQDILLKYKMTGKGLDFNSFHQPMHK
jgi:NitT/TauT family transport system substrate-binding protein